MAGRAGTTSVTASFDTSRGDCYPHYLSRFQVICDGQITSTTVAGRSNKVVMDIQDDASVASVDLSYRANSGEWMALPISRNGSTYTAILPELPAGCYVSLRLVAADPSGNSLDMTIDPAFYHSSGSISSAKSLPDGTFATLTDKSAVASFSDGFNLGDKQRTNGIRVLCSKPVSVGDSVAVSGMMGTLDGERVLTATSATPTGGMLCISPLSMQNIAVGGGPSGLQSAVSYWRLQRMPDGHAERVLRNAGGPSNVGMLVKIWGTITEIGSDYFYVHDGSGIDDGDALIKGIRVQGAYSGNEGDFVEVTGVSSCRAVSTPSGWVTTGMVRTRTSEDVVTIRRANTP